MNGYTLHQELRFTVCNEEFAITGNNGFRLQIEETRKNGQEDCHISGELVKRDGLWAWSSDWGRKSFDDYGNDGCADAIVAHVNANPPPELAS
jgi:hypothetical protein